MTVFAFDDIQGQSVAFNAEQDVLVFSGVEATDLIFDQAGNNVVVRQISTNSVATLTGTSLAQFATEYDVAGNALGEIDRVNILLSGVDSTLIFGDDDLSTDDDNGGNIQVSAIEGGIGVFGGSGAQTINMGNTSDEDFVIFGGAGVSDTADGADTITVGEGSGVVLGNAGDDEINFSTNDGSTASIFGGLGDDVIENQLDGADGTVSIVGGEGADTIDLDSQDFDGQFTIIGGNSINDTTDGADDISVGEGATGVILGNAGNDDISANGSDSVTVFGGLGNDSLSSTVLNGSGQFWGGAGEDVFNIQLSEDANYTIVGGNSANDSADGADQILIDGDDTGADVTVTVLGNGGNDTITLGDSAGIADVITATVFGGAGNDSVREIGADANISVDGGLGNDSFTLLGGDDTVTAGAGNDSVRAGAGSKVITTGEGSDTVISTGAFEDINVNTGSGNDSITLNAGGGNTGEGTVIAGVGQDTVSLTLTDDAAVTIFGGTEGIDTTDGADAITLLGTAAGNQSTATIFGNGGNDTITVSADALVTVFGGQGNDTINNVSTGTNDVLNGNEGNDSINAGDGNNTIDGGIGNDIIVATGGADSITGGAGDDNINAGDGANVILAGDGDDTVVATDGGDSITAGSGNDSIDAGDGNNTVLGGAGNDTIDTGAGIDSLTGGEGADTFIFDVSENTEIAGPTASAAGTENVVTDFDATEDSFVLNGANVANLVRGNFDNAGSDTNGMGENEDGASITANASILVVENALTSLSEDSLVDALGDVATELADGTYYALASSGTNSALFELTVAGSDGYSAADTTDVVALLNGVTTADLADFDLSNI